MSFVLLLLLLLACTGCGRYRDFTLPPLSGGDPRLRLSFEQQPEPVLRRESARDVLNPSVDGSDMLYSEFDGQTWRTARARFDGGRWLKLGIVLSPDPNTWEGSYIAANGSLLRFDGRLWYWYVAGPRERPRLGLARSTDGRVWRKEPRPVLDPGPYASWDEDGVADPYVIRIEPYFYVYYLGQDHARRQRLGVARSPDGIVWQKLRGNPVLALSGPDEFDENGLGEPAVWQSDGFYWMLYTGRDRAEKRRLGVARSTDGVHWRKLPGAFAGSAAWNGQVICDPSVEPDGRRVWFGGGDIARPDENLNGQIGLGFLHATLGK